MSWPCGNTDSMQPRYPTRERNKPKEHQAITEWIDKEAKRRGCILDEEANTIAQTVEELMGSLDNIALQCEHQDTLLSIHLEKANTWIGQANLCHHMALAATKDTPWKHLLKAYPEATPLAIEKELKALEKNILVPLTPDHVEWQDAIKKFCPGRIIGTVKKGGTNKKEIKARGVKQGFKENLVEADGPDFNYYSHVAKMATVRSLLMRSRRHHRHHRHIAAIDIRTAFLQSDKYPAHIKKYIRFKHPLTSEYLYYRQLAPIYGENSAPKRWEDTLFPWLTSPEDAKENPGCGLKRGENEPCVLYHEARDLVVVVYVDDILCDGKKEDIKWFFKKLEDRFECKESEWLTEDNPLDFLGMDISMDKNNVYLSMGSYITRMLDIMGIPQDANKQEKVPISSEILDYTPLPKELQKPFMTGVGCAGWLVNTVRCDASLAHSKIAQHMAKPTVGAWKALQQLMRYFKTTRNACIYQALDTLDEEPTWSFYCDSDFASNVHEDNKRRSQNGYLAMQGTAPVTWGSKVSSVAFAHPDIQEAHADISSGAAEVYAAANATFEFMHLSYIVEEMGNVPFPKPMILDMDNTTAECFVNNSCFKSKLKHIDVRQHWVRVIRDKNIIIPRHINTKDNLADIFTKVLDKDTFFTLSRQILMFPDDPHV